MIVAIALISLIVLAWLVDIACELMEAKEHPLGDEEYVDDEEVYSKY